MAGFVEVSLPRISITPLDRREDGYWTQALQPSMLKGGSWTMFNWNQLITSHAMQRVQHSSDLRVPQAEVDLEDLFEFMLDRGAVPDVKGIHMLRISGLWTPTGTSLMLSPDATQTALRISLPDDSDGVLSLALQWKAEWNNRDHASLPPGWMRLQFPPKTPNRGKKISVVDEKVAEPESSDPSLQDVNREGTDAPRAASRDIEASAEAKLEQCVASEKRGHWNSSFNPPLYTPAPTSLRFHISAMQTHPYIQINSPRFEHNHTAMHAAPLPLSTLTNPATPWLAPLSLILALASPHPTIYLSPPQFLYDLASASSMPCGVLVLAQLLSPNDTPEWETPEPPTQNVLEAHERFMSQQNAIARERHLPEAERQRAAQMRQHEQIQAMGMRAMKESRERVEREAKREREAIGSQRIQIETVAKAALGFLEGEGDVMAVGDFDQEKFEVRAADQIAVEHLLVAMYKAVVGLDSDDNNWAFDVHAMLDRWRDWVDRGGLNREDLGAIMNNKKAFCWAAVAVGLIAKVSEKETANGGGLLGDVRECMRVWKKIRLG
ncbi:MAG: hypothetical protein Q9222_006430 [Ikaeria aurantiellina]